MKCKYCISPYEYMGDDRLIRIIKMGSIYYLSAGTIYFDEFDSYDAEAEIEFCPKCGRKLNV